MISPERGPGGATPRSSSHTRQKRWILAMWTALGWPVSALDARCRRQFGVESFGWLRDQRQLQVLAKDLWNRCARKGLNPDPAALELRPDRADRARGASRREGER